MKLLLHSIANANLNLLYRNNCNPSISLATDSNKETGTLPSYANYKRELTIEDFQYTIYSLSPMSGVRADDFEARHHQH